MSTKKPPIHGYDHVTGGADPIPGLVANNLPWGFVQAQNISLSSSASYTVVDFDLTLVGRVGGTSGDGAISIGDVGASVKGIRLEEAGMYVVAFGVDGSLSAGSPAADSNIEVKSTIDTGDTIVGNYEGLPVVVSGGAGRAMASVLQIVNADASYGFLPDQSRVSIRQNTGLTATCFVWCWAARISTVTSTAFF